MNEVSFDFHGLAGFEYSGDSRGCDFYMAEYGAAKGLRPEAPGVTLRWNAAGRITGGTPTNHKLLARWTYRIADDEGKLRLEAAGNRWALPMVHHMLVHHALRLQVSRSGVILLHASAVARNGRSLILTGAGGGGKTTTSSLLLHAGGWAPHADDYVFLKESASHHYPSRAHLYLDLAQWIPGVYQILRPAERVRFQVLGRLRRLSGDRLKWPVRVAPSRLWPDRPPQGTSRIGAIVLLERTEVSRPQLTPVEDREAVRDTLIEMNFREAGHFVRLAHLAGFHSESSTWMLEWKERERLALARALDGVPLYRLDLPRSGRPSPAVGRQIVSLLDPLVGVAS